MIVHRDRFENRCSTEEHTSGLEARIARLVGDGKRVLLIGCASGELRSSLLAADCQEVAGDLEQVDLVGKVGDRRFDVIVAFEVVQSLKNPLTFLQDVKTYLEPGGTLIVSAPNVAHASVRLELLGGNFPGGASPLLDSHHVHFFTRESLLKTLEEAGYAVGYLDRQELTVTASDDSTNRVVSPELVHALASDIDARTGWYIAVAYPLPCREMTWFQECLRELAGQKETALLTANELRQTVALLEKRAADLLVCVDATTSRERDVREELLSVHKQMMLREEEMLDTVQNLLHQRDTLQRQVEVLEGRLERFRRSLPGRLYRGLRKVFRLEK